MEQQQQQQGVVVVDAKLEAGRGEAFSAARLRERWEAELDECEDFRLPIGFRPENSLNTDGLEMASLDVALPDHNRGYQMLLRMGWGGKGLGRNEDGITEPVRSGVALGMMRLGVGKADEVAQYTAAENVQRKKMEAEIQAEEDDHRKAKREMLVEQQQRIQEDVQQAKRPFYCEVCSKQYKTAMEMEAHLSSYDHHHRKRLKEMKAMTADRTRRDKDRKERKRMEKDLAKANEQFRRAQVEAQMRGEVAPGGAAQPPLPPPDDAAPPPPPLSPGAGQPSGWAQAEQPSGWGQAEQPCEGWDEARHTSGWGQEEEQAAGSAVAPAPLPPQPPPKAADVKQQGNVGRPSKMMAFQSVAPAARPAPKIVLEPSLGSDSTQAVKLGLGSRIGLSFGRSKLAKKLPITGFGEESDEDE